MSRHRNPALAALATASVALLAACGGVSAAAEPEITELKLGLPPGEADPELQEKYAPLSDLISEATGLPVEVTVTSDYLAIVEAMRSGLMDLGMFGPFPTPIAQDVADVQPLVAAKGAPYTSIIACSPDAGITSLEETAGATMAFVDPGSTSGNYIPRLMLTRAGIDPETDLEATFAGGHDSALLALHGGSIECAAAGRGAYDMMLEEGVIDEQTVVAESEQIPLSMTVIARDGLDPEIADAIVAAFTEPTPEQADAHEAALEIARATSFVAPTDEDFAIFREAAKELGVDLEDVE